MILSDQDISIAVQAGDICINPFNKAQLNPNSYNLRWTDKCLIYKDGWLDARKKNETLEIHLPEDGFDLVPGELYLFTTDEVVGSNCCVPMIEGRSSMGRLGISVHITAGFGDIGFLGKWTLEVTATKLVRVYPFMEVCQVFFHTVLTPAERKYTGKYQNQNEILPHIPD